jgi:hypothetical protein
MLMVYIEHVDETLERISIARCRELLGEEAQSMTDQEIASIRRHAETMALLPRQPYTVRQSPRSSPDVARRH